MGEFHESTEDVSANEVLSVDVSIPESNVTDIITNDEPAIEQQGQEMVLCKKNHYLNFQIWQSPQKTF